MPVRSLGLVVEALSSCATAAQVLEALADLAAPARGDMVLADLLEAPDLITRIVARGPDPDEPLPAAFGGPRARRSSAQGQGLLTQLTQAPHHRLRLHPDQLAELRGSADPRLRAQAELALAFGTTDLLVLGLACRGTLHGVLTLARCGGRYSEEELSHVAVLAQLGGLALENAHLRQVRASVSTALQRSLLPPLPLLPGLTLAARYVPASASLDVGGDWYDVFPLPCGATALVIGDATGHDIGSAAHMAELRTLLRAAAVGGDGRPAATLAELEDLGRRLGTPTSATCLFARLDGRTLTWSSAGHLPPVLVRGGEGRLLETAPELMLGVARDAERTDHTAELEPGDVLLLFTDGLVEARRQPLGERLDALAAAAAGAGSSEPEPLADLLVADLPAGDDDVALLVVRVDAA